MNTIPIIVEVIVSIIFNQSDFDQGKLLFIFLRLVFRECIVMSFILGISAANFVNSLVSRLVICNLLISAKSYMSLYSKVKLVNLLLIFWELTSLLRLFLAGK